MGPAMRDIVMPLDLGVRGGMGRMDGCHRYACFLDHFTTDTREFVVGGK